MFPTTSVGTAMSKRKGAAEMLQQKNILLFSRATYEMMTSFWPTEMALHSMPEVSKGMNTAEKKVFSKTLQTTHWNNSTIVKDDIIEKVCILKKSSKKDLTILGSGSIATQFTEAGLIDTYQIMIDPTAIGKGTPLFNNMKQDLQLTLT